jgi:PHD/YefM family antitoxin component YafN of YafNO toxin-antitoxin module
VLLVVFNSPDFWSKYYGWVIGISIFLFAVITYGYFIVMELTMNGMTLGKKLLKIRTIRNNGQPITLKHSAIRNLFRVFIDNYGVGVVLIFLTKQHKRIGDFAASTIVVVEESKTAPITLESLQRFNDKISYYISEEEYELLREYLERKSSMENPDEIREELKLHFTKKFEAMGVLDEWEGFIKEL